MFKQLVRYRHTIWYFALRQVKDRYAGTWGGLVWAVVHPIALLAIFWFVFEKGLRISAAEGTPFVLQLFCGLVPWMFIQEILPNATASVTGRAYLVKKIAFPSEILPYTNVVAALLTHALLCLILFGMLLFYGVFPGTALLLLPYYLVCLIAFAAGMSLILSAANVFYRDVGQVLNVLLNLWFWVTPIVWPLSLLPARFDWVLYLNPVAYIVQGYRAALLAPVLQFPEAIATLWFWTFTGALLFFGQRIFMRLKPSFADVL